MEQPTKKQIEIYNKVAAYLNETQTTATAQTDETVEDGREVVPCVRIVAGVTEFYNCKTGEKL